MNYLTKKSILLIFTLRIVCTLIKFDKNTSLAIHYLDHLIYNLFKESTFSVGPDFVDNIQIGLKHLSRFNDQKIKPLSFC